MTDAAVLFDRAVRGETEALNGLLATHRAVAYRIALGILGDADGAEDVAQDVAMRLTAALPGFHGPDEVSPWAYRVAVNRCRDHLRRRRRRAGDVPFDTAPPHPELTREDDPARAVDSERTRAAVQDALHRLSDDPRAVLTLRYMAGLEYAEIARMTSTPQGTIASRVFRALKRLGDQLDRRHLEVLE